MTTLGLLAVCTDGAIPVYQNTFDDASGLNHFTIFGESFAGYSAPPLHDVSVGSGLLNIQTYDYQPNGPGTIPILSGLASLMQNTSTFAGGYNSVISQNRGVVSWSFNVANRDGRFNNGFGVVLLSTMQDSYNIGAKGYYFTGGSMVGNRMGLWRFDFGLGGGQSPIIDIPDGLGQLPQKGAFKITYNPTSNEWKLYGEISNEFVDPESVTNLLGAGVEGTYTRLNTPFMGLCGNNTGLDVFDNLTVNLLTSPPIIVCPFPLTLECSNGYAMGTLKVDVADTNGFPLQVVWAVDGTPYQTNYIPAGGIVTTASLTFTANFASGNHSVVVTASNGGEEPTSCSTTVAVIDTKSPQIFQIAATPNVLWPPKKQMVSVQLAVDAVDNCDPSPKSKIIGVVSNEQQTSSKPDWKITGPLTVQLRAERLKRGRGRKYTITVQCEDASGNVSYIPIEIPVRPNRRR